MLTGDITEETYEPTPEETPTFAVIDDGRTFPAVVARRRQQNGSRRTTLYTISKTGDTLTYTRPPVPTSSNLISNASESDLIAAGVLASAIPSLLAAGLVKKVTVTGSRLILLGFDPDLWTEDYRLK